MRKALILLFSLFALNSYAAGTSLKAYHCKDVRIQRLEKQLNMNPEELLDEGHIVDGFYLALVDGRWGLYEEFFNWDGPLNINDKGNHVLNDIMDSQSTQAQTEACYSSEINTGIYFYDHDRNRRAFALQYSSDRLTLSETHSFKRTSHGETRIYNVISNRFDCQETDEDETSELLEFIEELKKNQATE